MQSSRAYIFIRCVVIFSIGCWLWLPLSSIFSGTNIYLTLPVDDFFYYVRIAQHIIQNGMVSFDGITITNGFHPLWLGIITLLMFFTQGANPAFFVIIYLFCGASAYITFQLFLRTGKNLGLPDWFTLVLSLSLFPHAVGIIFDMMEGALVIPLMLLLINYIFKVSTTETITTKRSIILGLLSSFLILSRFETAIFIALLIIGWLIGSNTRVPEKIKTLSMFCLGAAPLVLMLLWNIVFIGNIFPVSILAKILRGDGIVGMSFFSTVINRKAYSDMLLCIVAPAALLFLLIRRKKIYLAEDPVIQKNRWYVVVAVILFPFIFYSFLSLKNDIYPWYFYPVPITLFFSIGIFFVSFPKLLLNNRKNIIRIVQFVVFGYAIINPIYHAFKERATLSESGGWGIYTRATDLRAFTIQHPGIYAMGDEAGLTSFITDGSFVQLEGLACDLRMIEHIKDQDNLNAVLAEYGVDYLITTSDNEIHFVNGCYADFEPFEYDGKKLLHTMQGSFCTNPSLIVNKSGQYLYVFPVSQKAIEQMPRESVNMP